MTRRRLFLLMVVALPLLWGGYRLTVALTFEAGATEANVGRIRGGMTLAEVEAIMGREGFPDIWRPGGSFVIFYYCPVLKCSPVRVCFDDSRRVFWAEWRRDHSPTPLGRLRSWLGW